MDPTRMETQGVETFRWSSPIDALATSLSKFQGEVPPVERGATGQHRNRYATLDAILDVTRSVLAKHDLAIVQGLAGPASRMEMVTLLLHSSGQFIEMRLGLQDVLDATYEAEAAKISDQGKVYGMDPAQVLGAVATYARRNGVCSILGISTEEDTDSAGAREPTERRPASTKERPKPPKPTKRDSKSNQKAMTDVQREKIQKLAQAGGFSDDDLTRVCRQEYGVLPSEVNFGNAKHLIARLEDALSELAKDESLNA